MAPLWFRELRSVLVTGKVGVAHAKSIGTPIFMGAITPSFIVKGKNTFFLFMSE